MITVTGNALQSFEPDTLFSGDKYSHNETMDASCIGYPVLERRRRFSRLFLYVAGPPTVSGPQWAARAPSWFRQRAQVKIWRSLSPWSAVISVTIGLLALLMTILKPIEQ